MEDRFERLGQLIDSLDNLAHTLKTLAQQCAIHGVVRSCYWCDVPITDKDEVEELPEGRGEAHKKCADEWYGSQMGED